MRKYKRKPTLERLWIKSAGERLELLKLGDAHNQILDSTDLTEGAKKLSLEAIRNKITAITPTIHPLVFIDSLDGTMNTKPAFLKLLPWYGRGQ